MNFQHFHHPPAPMWGQSNSQHRPPPPIILSNPPPMILHPQPHQPHPHVVHPHSEKRYTEEELELREMKAAKAEKARLKAERNKKAWKRQKYGPQHFQEEIIQQNEHHEQYHEPQNHDIVHDVVVHEQKQEAHIDTSDTKRKDQVKGKLICTKGSTYFKKYLKKKWQRGLIFLLIFACMLAHIAILRQTQNKIQLTKEKENIKNYIIGSFVGGIFIFVGILGLASYCQRSITLSILFLIFLLFGTVCLNIHFIIQFEK